MSNEVQDHTTKWDTEDDPYWVPEDHTTKWDTEEYKKTDPYWVPEDHTGIHGFWKGRWESGPLRENNGLTLGMRSNGEHLGAQGEADMLNRTAHEAGVKNSQADCAAWGCVMLTLFPLLAIVLIVSVIKVMGW